MSQNTSAPVTPPIVSWDDAVDPDYHHASEQAYENFRDWKVGLRIHFYLGLQIGAKLGSWWLYENAAARHPAYFDLSKTFNPVEFDAGQWAELFVAGGLKYFTLVTKHHDGFCPWPTRTRVKRRWNYSGAEPVIEESDLAYSVAETPFKRDIVREVVDAGRERGLGIGLYYSHWDWYDADFRWGGIGHVPYDPNFTSGGDPEGYARFLARYRGQLTELLKDYGKIDLMEFDCEPRGTYEPYRERGIRDWGKIWPDIKKIIKEARLMQPDILFRERGIGSYGDFHTPEWQIPVDANPESESKSVKVWQVIYPCFDETQEWMLNTLIDVVAKGGNLQFGFLPQPTGSFSAVQIERLKYVGDWLKVNGEAIYCTRPRSGAGMWEEGDDVRYTRSKDAKIDYAIFLKWPGRRARLNSVNVADGAEIRMLGAERPLRWKRDGGAIDVDLPEEMENEKARPCRQAFSIRIPVR